MKKCGKCGYCAVNPPRLPPDMFDELHFIPNPVLNQEGKYKPFEEVYGQVTDEKDRPALKEKPQLTERDKNFKALLVAGVYNLVMQ